MLGWIPMTFMDRVHLSFMWSGTYIIFCASTLFEIFVFFNMHVSYTHVGGEKKLLSAAAASVFVVLYETRTVRLNNLS